MNISGISSMPPAVTLSASGPSSTPLPQGSMSGNTAAGVQVNLSAEGLNRLQQDLQGLSAGADWEQVLKAAILLKALSGNEKDKSDDGSLVRMLIAAAAIKALDQANSGLGVGVAAVPGTSLTVTVSG